MCDSCAPAGIGSSPHLRSSGVNDCPGRSPKIQLLKQDHNCVKATPEVNLNFNIACALPAPSQGYSHRVTEMMR